MVVRPSAISASRRGSDCATNSCWLAARSALTDETMPPPALVTRAKRKAKFQVGQKVTVGCSLILVAAALAVGWWFWSLQRASADLDRQMADAARETQRLQGVIQQVTQFEGRRAQLQQRVTLIEELRKGQTGPVHLLDQISKALPEAMWLTDLRQAANDITLEGRCTSLNSLSAVLGVGT